MGSGTPHSQSLRIAAGYAIVGACWILFSDRIANALVQDPGALLRVNTLKGWCFVAVTALLLHLLVRRQLVRITGETAARADAEAGRARAERQREFAREEAVAAGQRLALATRAARIGTWELDVATGRVLGDEQMYMIYGYCPGEIPGTLAAWMDRIHPDDRSMLNRRIQAALDGGQEYHPLFRLLLPDGQIRFVEGHATVQRGPEGRPLRLIGVNWDITDRVLAEQRYRLLADNIGDVLWTLDLDTRRFTYVSPSIEKLRGYTPAEVLNQSLEDCLAPASLALVNATLPARVQAFLTGDPAAVTQVQEIEQYHRNGSTVWTEVVTTLLLKPSGGLEVIGVTRDISQRRAAELALSVSSQRLRHAEELAGIGHWSIQLDTGAVEGSAGAARIYGLNRDRWDLATVQAIPLREYRVGLDEALRALVAEGRPYDELFKIRRPDTGAVVSIHSRAEYDAATGTVFGVFQDITAQEQALEAVRTSEAKLRLLVSNAPVVLFQIDAAGIFGMSEGRGLEKLGLRSGQVVGQSVFDVYREVPEIVDQVRAALEGRTIQEITTVGATVFEISYHPLADADGRITDVIGLAVDITARKQAEAQLRLHGAALAAAAHAIAITDARGLIEWVNPAFTKLTGYSPEEAVGCELGKLGQSGQQTGDYYRHLWPTIAGGDTWHGELVDLHKDGTPIAEEETITPVRDEQGRIAHYIVVKQDITERRRLQEQVLRSQRLDSVGRLAGGIAHDLNNILVPILMAPGVLRETITDPSAHEILDTLEASAKRGAAIIRQLLTFSRGSGGQRVPVQVSAIVGDMVAIIRETFPKSIRTGTHMPAEPWLVEGDPTQLHQVLMNLCVNSRDSMSDGGTLTIELENIELDAAALAGRPGTVPGPYLRLGVFDSGIGIAADQLDKVFDPFFTTKEVGKGTGLGLATVLGIVQAHHGFVQISSKIGAGTQVRVYLPAAPGAIAPVVDTEPSKLRRGRGELILIVDDEDNVRRLTRRILEDQGYRVITAGDGAEALARFQQHRESIQLILTDLIMPFMDGAEFIQSLRKLDPGVRIVATSGAASGLSSGLSDLDTVSTFLPKPYSRLALLETVAAALPPSLPQSFAGAQPYRIGPLTQVEGNGGALAPLGGKTGAWGSCPSVRCIDRPMAAQLGRAAARISSKVSAVKGF